MNERRASGNRVRRFRFFGRKFKNRVQEPLAGYEGEVPLSV